jgi:CheY-like chemotaxis protein
MTMDDRVINILLVEDDEVDVMTVKRAFAKANITNPLLVANNGIEFLREVRADPKLQTVSVVVLTTSNEERDRIEAFKLNVAGYLLKPVTFGQFAEVMSTINKYWALMEMP